MKKTFWMLTLSLVMAAFSHSAMAAITINITKGNSDPMPIALPDLNGSNGSDSSLGKDVMQIVSADLERSGLFKPIPPASFIEKLTYGQVTPRFADWRAVSAQALVTGSITGVDANTVTVAFRLWDVTGDEQIAGKEFTTLRSNWRRIGHLIADEVYKRLTGEEGYFDSRVVYVAESGPAQRRIKRLAIMDQDGANHKFLTDGAYMALTPRFSPTFQEVIYLSYEHDMPRVHIRNLESGREDIVGQFKGMTFAPRYSGKGDKIVMSYARDGNTDVYMMDLRTRQTRALTNSPAIETTPSYSPDDRRIVFESDRGGSQQLYVMNADGGGAQRISFGEGRYGSPVWSPRGDIIAFTKMHQGQFYIGVMRADGSGERLLTNGYLVEGATWSPNGRVLMFARGERSRGNRAGSSRIYSIDLTGKNEREVMTPMDASDPSWSGLLPL